MVRSDAHPGVARQRYRTVEVEQSSRRARRGAQGSIDRPEGVLEPVREQAWRGQQHDREVLGDVAGILGCPVRVVAETRVCPRLELVEVVVCRVEDVPGRDDVVGEQRDDRDRRPEEDRGDAPAPSDPWSDDEEERCRKDHGEPGRRREADQKSAEERPPRRPVRRCAWAPSPLARPAAAASAPSASPTASIVRPTATMCAWYHVVVFCAVYQNTVPKAKRTVVPSLTDGRDPEPADHPPAQRDVDCREDGEDQLVVGAEPEGRHERHKQDGGEWRERDQRPLAATCPPDRAARPGRSSSRTVQPC